MYAKSLRPADLDYSLVVIYVALTGRRTEPEWLYMHLWFLFFRLVSHQQQQEREQYLQTATNTIFVYKDRISFEITIQFRFFWLN